MAAKYLFFEAGSDGAITYAAENLIGIDHQKLSLLVKINSLLLLMMTLVATFTLILVHVQYLLVRVVLLLEAVLLLELLSTRAGLKPLEVVL